MVDYIAKNRPLLKTNVAFENWQAAVKSKTERDFWKEFINESPTLAEAFALYLNTVRLGLHSQLSSYEVIEMIRNTKRRS